MRKSTLAKTTSLATLDQAVVSLTNFVVGMVVIRFCSLEEYGHFVFANAVLLFIIGAHGAFITTPMSIVLPQQQGPQQNRFPLGIMLGQFLLSLLLLIFLGSILWWFGPSQHTRILTSVFVVSSAVLLKDFIRMWFYTVLDAGLVLVVDAAYAVLLVGGLFFIARTDDLTAASIFWAIGTTSLVISLVFLSVILRQRPVDRRWDWTVVAQIVKLGRWGFLGCVITWFQTQSYIYLLLLTIGSAETALASGPRLFFAPLAFIASGWGVVYKPWGARIVGPDLMKPIRVMMMVTAALIVFSLAYGAALTALHTPLIEFVLGEQYRGIDTFVFVLWSLYFSAQIVRSGVSNTLQLAQEFRILSLVSAAGSIVTVVVSYLLIVPWGVHGSIIGLIIGELFLVLLCSYQLLSYVRKRREVTMAKAECVQV